MSPRSLLLLLSCWLCAAHSASHHRARSLGGLHAADAAATRRAALIASLAAQPALAPAAPAAACNLTHATGGYWEACGGASGNLGPFSGLSAASAAAACCAAPACAGLSFACHDAQCATGSGYYKGNVGCGFVSAPGYQGFARPGALPAPPVVRVTVLPASPLAHDVTNVTVSFAFASGAVNRTTDWVGQVCAGSPIEDYLEYAPVDFFEGWEGGSGSFVFSVFRTRCDYEFRYFRGAQPLWPSGQAVGVSAPVTFAGPPWGSHPFHAHVAYGGEDAQHGMTLSFTTNASVPVSVMLGTAPGVYDLPNATEIESTTYGAGDLCNAPANTTSVDFWQWPGVFNHASLRGLQPATRYYARPVAGDGNVGEEVTFVTGSALGPGVRTTFAAYGDMSDTQYVLVGDTQKDTPDGGPGAVGTAQRLRQRIDAGEALDFVLHFGDLGYAKGAVYLWDAWMSMMAHVGSRVPYMVSIGKCVGQQQPPPLPRLRALTCRLTTPPLSAPPATSTTTATPLQTTPAASLGARTRTCRLGTMGTWILSESAVWARSSVSARPWAATGSSGTPLPLAQ